MPCVVKSRPRPHSQNPSSHGFRLHLQLGYELMRTARGNGEASPVTGNSSPLPM